MPIKKAVITLSVALSAFLFPLMPLAAHAAYGAALTGNAGIDIVGSRTTTTDESAALDVGLPMIITHASAEASLAASSSAVSEQNSSEGLREQADAIVSGDPKASTVVLSKDTVSLSYREPAKLFGFIGVEVPVTVSVHADGIAAVNYPWYSFLLSTDQTSLMIKTQAAISSTLGAKTNTSATLSVTEKAHLLSALHDVMRSEANGDVSVDTTVVK